MIRRGDEGGTLSELSLLTIFSRVPRAKLKHAARRQAGQSLLYDFFGRADRCLQRCQAQFAAEARDPWPKRGDSCQSTGGGYADWRRAARGWQ